MSSDCSAVRSQLMGTRAMLRVDPDWLCLPEHIRRILESNNPVSLLRLFDAGIHPRHLYRLLAHVSPDRLVSWAADCNAAEVAHVAYRLPDWESRHAHRQPRAALAAATDCIAAIRGGDQKRIEQAWRTADKLWHTTYRLGHAFPVAAAWAACHAANTCRMWLGVVSQGDADYVAYLSVPYSDDDWARLRESLIGEEVQP